MPANLNALLRYKTIDKCLKNQFKKCTIEYLIEKCSEALSEFKGKNTSVSERTIREDLKILKSDALGFNAPIVFENNEYRYSTKKYSIFDTKFKELKLLSEIKEILVDEFENIKSDKKYALLYKIAKITKETLPKKCYHKDLDNFNFFEKKVFIPCAVHIEKETIPLPRYDEYPKTYKVVYYWSWFKTKRKVVDLENKEYFSWEYILDTL